jgi:hypothetical protein
MQRFVIIIITFLFSNVFFAQNKKQVKIDLNDLMVEINNISRTNNQYVKYDSLLDVISSMQQKLENKDSVISTLKNKVNVVQLKSDQIKETEYYVIIGAFKIPENAVQLSKTKSRYPLKIYTFPTSKLNYVGYKVKLTDPFLLILNYFRQKVVKDAWVLKITN